MRKFKDLTTGAKLETDNEFVIAQYEKYAERYSEIKSKSVKEETEAVKEEIEAEKGAK